MKRITVLSTLLLISLSCSDKHDNESPAGSHSLFSREYAGASATLEQIGGCPPIVWDEDDAYVLLSSGEREELSLVTRDYLTSIPESEQIDVIMVNPVRSGRFAGFDNYNEIKEKMKLSTLYPSIDKTAENLEAIAEMAASLRDNPCHIFTLTRTAGGWNIVHRKSGKSFSGRKNYSSEKSSGAIWNCEWIEEGYDVQIEDASAMEGTSNLAIGCPSQLFITKDGLYLWSGGQSDPMSWFEGADPVGFCTWLMYRVPGSGLEYRIDDGQAGKSEAAFTGEKLASGAKYYAVYPFDEKTGSDNGNIRISVPAEQRLTNGAYSHANFPAAGTVDANGKVAFRNILGAINIPVQGKGRLTAISIKEAGGRMLCGEATVRTESVESGSFELEFSEGNDEVRLDCNGGGGIVLSSVKAVNLTIAVPAGTISKESVITVETTDGVFVRNLSRAANVRCGQSTVLETVNLEGLNGKVHIVRTENPLVAEYVDNVSYISVEDEVFSKNCTSIFVNDFRSRVLENTAYRTDQPSFVEVTWPTASATKVNVLLAEDGNWSSPLRDTLVSAGASCFRITNMLPGRHYYWKVLDGKGGKELCSGRFDTEGWLRMIAAEGGWNIRDLGGLVSSEYGNRPLRYEWLYRGGSLNLAEDDARSELRNLGIRAELDLRGALNPTDGQEIGASANINDIGTYTFGYSMIYGADFRQIMTDYSVITGHHPYPAIYANALVKDMAWIIYELRKPEVHPVYFHCKLGADRTTAVAYMIEALLGVRPADIARDHELTSFARDTGGYLTRYVTGNDVQHETFMNQLEVPEGCNTLAQKVYWYFNNQFGDLSINADDLDWFICNMLEMSQEEFDACRRDWTFDTVNRSTTLQDVFESPTINY